MSDSLRPAPPTDVKVVQVDETSALVSWQGWTLMAGPIIGPNYHTLQLYLSAAGPAKVQVSLNGVAQTQYGQLVSALYANQTEQVFTYTGTWDKPPQVLVRMPPTTGAKLYLNAATYDGAMLADINHEFDTQGQYKFTP